MKRIIEKYEYTKKEEQYESYDLSEVDYVEAEYIKSVNTFFNCNPFIEALPQPYTSDECIVAYTKAAPFSHSDLNKLDYLQKIQTLEILNKIKIPLPFDAEVEMEFYRALCDSYSSRYQLYNDNEITFQAFGDEQVTKGKIVARQSSPSVVGFSLIGNSGCGKSSAIELLTNRYPQVIRHPNSAGRITQIVYLVVNCPPNSNFNTLYVNIAAEIDKALGITNNFHENLVANKTGLSNKYTQIKRLIEAFGIGIIIFDEIQQLDFKGIKDNTFEALLELSNETKIAIAAVGTEDALHKMFPNERTARRVGKTIPASQYCDNKQFFKYLLSMISKYYWFDKPLSLNDDIIDTLYKYSGGIIAHLITIYKYMNYDYIKADKKPVIDVKFIDKVIKNNFNELYSLIKKNKNNKASIEKQNQILDEANAKFSKITTQDQMSLQSDIIINTETNNNSSELLNNIIKNISNCFGDMYPVDKITKVYNDLCVIPKNNRLTEQEFTQLVIKKLMTIKNKTKAKAKLSSEEIIASLSSSICDN